MAEVPPNGVPWSIFTPTMRSAIEYWAGVEGVPVQAMMNIIWRESGTGSIEAGTARIQDQAPTHGPGVYGPAGLNQNTYPGVGVTNPHDESQAAMGLARIMRTYGTGGVIHDNNYQLGSLPFDLNRVAVWYNWGPGSSDGSSRGRLWEASGRNNDLLPEQTRTYLENITRGTNVAPPSVGTQGERSGAWTDANVARDWRLNDEALGFLGPGGQVRTNEAWGVNPVGDFWRLQQGPSGSLGRSAAWDTPGIINPEYGHYLQTQGLMPANLQPTGGTDFTNTTWTGVPGAQPGWWGPWGAENVHNWAQEGISHGYGDPIMSMLGNLNYNLVDPGLPPGSPPLGGQPAPIGPTTGLPGTATAGVDLAHWLAQQWGTGWGNIGADRPSNVYNAGNMFPQDMPLPWDRNAPRIQTWDAHPDLQFWDAGAPGPRVGDNVPNWTPAGGTWGTPGAVSPFAGVQEQQAGGGQGMTFNPATMNWGTFSGGVGNQVQDYNRWYEDVIGGSTPTPTGFNPVGTTQPDWGQDLAAVYGQRSGNPGYGAALNPIFAGMYYSQIPTQTAIIGQQQQQQLHHDLTHPNVPGWDWTSSGTLVPTNPINVTPNPNPWGPGTPFVGPGVVRTGLEPFGT